MWERTMLCPDGRCPNNSLKILERKLLTSPLLATLVESVSSHKKSYFSVRILYEKCRDIQSWHHLSIALIFLSNLLRAYAIKLIYVHCPSTLGPFIGIWTTHWDSLPCHTWWELRSYLATNKPNISPSHGYCPFTLSLNWCTVSIPVATAKLIELNRMYFYCLTTFYFTISFTRFHLVLPSWSSLIMPNSTLLNWRAARL